MTDTPTRERLLRENATLLAGIVELERTIAAARRPVDHADRDAMAVLQSRADSIALHFGERADAPRLGEQPAEFRLRLLQKFQRHSPAFAAMDLARADAAFITAAAPKIFDDAEAAGRADAQASGHLIPTTITDRTGRKNTRYEGDIFAFMAPFVSGGIRARIHRPGFD